MRKAPFQNSQQWKIEREHSRMKSHYNQKIIQMRIEGGHGLTWLPHLDPKMSDSDLSIAFYWLLRPWDDSPAARLGLLTRACPPGDKDAYLLHRFLLKGWIKEFEHRQRRLKARWSAPGGDPDARSLCMRNRAIITRLISILRASRRYAGQMADLAHTL
jgi:hypothetical protein